MINREVIYDRNLTGSYMKIPVSIGHEFDERMMLRRKLPGLLPVERCYIDGTGQYWYNISGKQSLDTYCRIQKIGIDFMERMIISICSEIEILECNLLDQNCLLLDPEQVFVTNQNQEIIFAIYPGHHEQISSEFQQLMEYLLTKIDHMDQEAVRIGYAIYEKTLDEAYSIMDIRDEIIARRCERTSAVEAAAQVQWKSEAPVRSFDKEVLTEKDVSFEEDMPGRKRYESLKTDNIRKQEEERQKHILDQLFGEIRRIYQEWRQNLAELLGKDKKLQEAGREEAKRAPKQQDSWIAYPDDPIPEEKIQIHPTVCLGEYAVHPEGILMYEGTEQLQNLRITSQAVRIGKAEDAELRIEKDTISRYHARIDAKNKEYYIEDLNSTNGTYINDELLPYKEVRQLKSNDIIRFADVKYRFL